jgi:hypothetical protein
VGTSVYLTLQLFVLFLTAITGYFVFTGVYPSQLYSPVFLICLLQVVVCGFSHAPAGYLAMTIDSLLGCVLVDIEE